MTHRDRDPLDRDLSLDEELTDPDRDGVASLHDTEAGAGDEDELVDAFDIDRREAHQLGADLDEVDPDESPLN